MPTGRVQYNDDEKLAMARAADALVAKWRLPDEAANRLLDGDERAAALLDIDRALRCIFADSDRAAQWISAPNKAFDGTCALDLMLTNGLAGMQRVKTYLDAEVAS